ncbi:MAG: hypothetical protein ABJC13_19580 [Acidobacteriota bacterium]
MNPTERRILRLVAFLAATTLIAASTGWAAQTSEPAPEPPAAAPAPHAIPHVTGTIVKVITSRIDLKLKNGKIQKIAINEGTQRLVELEKGVEVTVEYRRKISAFIIAERVLAADAKVMEPVPAPVIQTAMATGEILSATNASLVLHVGEGDVTFYLIPTTEILVQPLALGQRVTVEYRENKDQAKVAVKILAAAAEEPTEVPGNVETPPNR